MHIGLDCHLGKSQHHSSKDIDDDLPIDPSVSIQHRQLSRQSRYSGTYLLADTARIASEHDISTQQSRDKGIIPALFSTARWIQVFQGK